MAYQARQSLRARWTVVTSQDRTPVVIRKALDVHLLQQKDPKNYELLHIVWNHQKLRVPADAKVYYGLIGGVHYNFLLRETDASKSLKVKPKEVTCVDTVTSLIRRALDQNLLQQEDVDNFELLRMISENEKIKVPDHSLMYQSMNPRIKYFIVRKRPEFKRKEFSESTCKSSRPLFQVGDTCLIHVHLETQSPKMAKKVLVTCQDRAPVVIHRALELHLLTQEKPEDYELGQIISHHHKLRIPAQANVFYAKNPHIKPNFVLRKRSLSQKNDEWIQPQPPSHPTKKAAALLRMLAKPFCCCVPGQG
ncbi:uncharacterized protein LOC144366835 isoform X2 [Ictidomys tridecemlineatus]